jgi:hypothetical protein
MSRPDVYTIRNLRNHIRKIIFMSVDTGTFYCCDFSRETGEQLFATASRADVWLLLEYSQPWGAKAFEESDLSQPIKNQLSAHLRTIPNSRLQYIRRQKAGDGIAFYVAVVDESAPVLYRFDLTSYEDLLALDIPAIVANGAAHREYTSEEALFIVCVNNKRDRSCARYGLPVYQALVRHAGEAVWQSSHIGGHRFAGTGVGFPHGTVYGRMNPLDAVQVVDAYQQGRIVLEHYRGRSCYEPVVQAADYFLREQTGVLELNGFRLVDVERISESVSAVRFTALADNRVHRVEVQQEMSDFGIYSNSADTEAAPVPQFRLVETA